MSEIGVEPRSVDSIRAMIVSILCRVRVYSKDGHTIYGIILLARCNDARDLDSLEAPWRTNGSE